MYPVTNDCVVAEDEIPFIQERFQIHGSYMFFSWSWIPKTHPWKLGSMSFYSIWFCSFFFDWCNNDFRLFRLSILQVLYHCNNYDQWFYFLNLQRFSDTNANVLDSGYPKPISGNMGTTHPSFTSVWDTSVLRSNMYFVTQSSYCIR